MRTGNVLPERGNISDLDIFFLFSLPTVIMIDLFFRVKFRRITRLLWNGDLFQSAATSEPRRSTYYLRAADLAPVILVVYVPSLVLLG